MPEENAATRFLTAIMAAAGYAVGAVIILLNVIVLVGILVLGLKYAFGIELLSGFDWFLPDWFQKLFVH